jgi:hypothetical protein
MATIQLQSKFNVVNEPLSVDSLIVQYLTGIPLQTANGQSMSYELIEQKIKNAVSELERYLDIKITKQVVYETKDYSALDWVQWNSIRTTYPIQEVFELKGKIGPSDQISYPKDWISVRSRNDDNANRSLFVVAGSASSSAQPIMVSGILPHLTYRSSQWIPNYWHIVYVSGFEKVPHIITSFIGKFAAMQVLSILGDGLYKPGISSSSISIDGLSQSTSSTFSAQGGIFAGRVKQYADELKQSLSDLRAYYKGISVSVC